MPCQLCGAPSHSGRNHDFRGFLARLSTSDREKLLRAAAVTKAEPKAPAARWLNASADGLRVADPNQVAYHSDPSQVILDEA